MSSLPLQDTDRCLEQVNLKVHSAGAATTGTDIDEARAFHFIFPPPTAIFRTKPSITRAETARTSCRTSYRVLRTAITNKLLDVEEEPRERSLNPLKVYKNNTFSQ
jgi:hypothetical protein